MFLKPTSIAMLAIYFLVHLWAICCSEKCAINDIILQGNSHNDNIFMLYHGCRNGF